MRGKALNNHSGKYLIGESIKQGHLLIQNLFQIINAAVHMSNMLNTCLYYTLVPAYTCTCTIHYFPFQLNMSAEVLNKKHSALACWGFIKNKSQVCWGIVIQSNFY